MHIVEAFVRRWTRLTERRHSVTTVSHADAIRWFEGRRSSYERLVDAVVSHVPRDGVIFDVGANIGFFTALLAERTDFRGRAYLFEPLPHLAELCKQTFATIPCEARVMTLGLSDKAAKEDLMVAANGNLGWNTLVGEKASADMHRVPVNLLPFSECGIDNVPSLIKIDVEGLEYKVLRGMLVHLRRWDPKPVILCEVGWGHTHPAWAEELAVFAEVERIGYTVTGLAGNAIALADISQTTDVLLVPDKRHGS